MMAYRRLLHSACRTLHRHRPTTAPSIAAASLPPDRRCRLPARTAASIIYARDGNRCVGAPMSSLQHHRRHSSEDYGSSRRRNDDEFRDDDDIDENTSVVTTSARRRRLKTTKCGRARRKWISGRRRRGPTTPASDGGTKGDDDDDDDDDDNDDMTPAHEREDGNVPFGVPMGNPIRERYIQSLRKVNYPRTLAGWKTVLNQTWETYLWTFEGFLIKEKRRDANGNIIPEDEEKDATDKEGERDGDVNAEDGRSLHDRATDAAGAVTENLQNNIIAIKRETPKLVKLGQEMTGVSSREELKEWVGDQLKLGTACLSEFMKGYRKGRDQEIDRMLNEYFKELDGEEKESDEVDPTGSANSEKIPEDKKGSGDARRMRRGRRSWGRRARRKMKMSSAQPENAKPKDLQLNI
jgi:hypothetical protein